MQLYLFLIVLPTFAFKFKPRTYGGDPVWFQLGKLLFACGSD